MERNVENIGEQPVIDEQKSKFYKNHCKSFVYNDNEATYIEGAASDVYYNLEPETIWTSDLPERILKVAETIGGSPKPDAKRFLENLYVTYVTLNNDGKEIDLNEFCGYIELAEKNFGRYTRGWFTTRYKDAILLGFSPKEYYDLVDYAVKNGGKRLAGYFLSSFSSMFESGFDETGYFYRPKDIKPTTILAHLLEFSNKVGDRIKGKAKIYRAYLGASISTDLAKETSLNQLTENAIEIINNYDEKSAFTLIWNMRNLDNLSYFDYTSLEYLRSVSEVRRNFSEKSACWYAYGIGKLAGCFGNTSDTSNQLEKNHIQFDPNIFTQNYKNLLKSVGKNAAVFYSLTAGNKALDVLPKKLAELHKELPKKDFDKAIWYMSQTYKDPNSIISYIETLIDVQNFPEQPLEEFDGQPDIQIISPMFDGIFEEEWTE